ncbi:MAG: tetratricopeptide repeat protein [Weeksellaceae bacterium]|jgi:signal transduction histidine kinase|nr:tetratricopeptide repeat protein [Weeksellaceae bacterium]
MKNTVRFLFFLFSSLLFSQENSLIQKIDSLNNLPYEKRIETSSHNLKKYLNNAETARSIDYQKGIADSYSTISLIYFYQGKYDLSTDYFFRTVKIYENLNLEGEIGYQYSLYGYRLRHTDIEKSMYYMQKGIYLAEKNNRKIDLMGMYDNYGLVKEANNEKDSAEFFFRKSLNMKREAKDETGIPYSLNKLGTLYLSLKNFKEAKDFFDEAYAIRLKLNDEIGIAENLSFYGLYYSEIKDFPQAISYYEKALTASKEAGYRWLTLRLYEDFSALLEQQNQFKKALDYHKQYVAYKDSIYNLDVTATKKELEIEFETEVKEKQILEQKADLAEQKIELQQKSFWIYMLISLLIIIGLIGFQIHKTQLLKNKQLIKENELKSALITIEAQNKVQEERLRISRDLHDNIGSQLTFIISSLDNLKFLLQKDNSAYTERISEINNFTRGTILELRDTIWAMNKQNIHLSDLKNRLNNFLKNAQNSIQNIHFELNMNDEIDDSHSFSAFEGVNLFRVIQEAVNNAVKHSAASEIKVNFDQINQHYLISIHDNGKGIDSTQITHGNGLNNMHKRILDIGGELNIRSEINQGTTLEITL